MTMTVFSTLIFFQLKELPFSQETFTIWKVKFNRRWIKSIKSNSALRLQFAEIFLSFTKIFDSREMVGVVVKCFEFLWVIMDCFWGSFVLLWTFFYLCGSLWIAVDFFGELRVVLGRFFLVNMKVWQNLSFSFISKWCLKPGKKPLITIKLLEC